MNHIKVLVLVCFLFANMLLSAQDSFSSDNLVIEPPVALTTNRKDDANLKTELRLHKQVVKMISDLRINTIECDGFVSDSSDTIVELKSEMFLYLKNSFYWNIDDPLPHIPKASVIRSLLRKKENLTEEEWKTIKYMEFYARKFDSDCIDKYIYNQEVEVNENRRFIIHYEFVFDCDKNFKLKCKIVEEIEKDLTKDE